MNKEQNDLLAEAELLQQMFENSVKEGWHKDHQSAILALLDRRTDILYTLLSEDKLR